MVTHISSSQNRREQSPTVAGKRVLLLKSLLAVSILWAVPVIACGSFAPRATPTPTQIQLGVGLGAQPAANDTPSAPTANNNTNPTLLPVAPTVTPIPQPTPTFTSTPEPGTAIAVGQPARVVAPYGLNLRTDTSANAQLLTQLGSGQRVTVVDGPISAEGYTWWKVEDSAGNSGWGVDGDGENTWISPNVGGSQPVNRSPRVNERVRVTMPGDLQLTIRSLPGVDAPVLIRVDSGTEFSVVDGPRNANGYVWFRIRSNDGNIAGWAAEADNNQANRWLSPLE